MAASQSRDVVSSIFERGWNQGDFAGVEHALAAEFTFHVHGSARTMSRGDLERIVAAWRRGFPDLHFHVHEVVGEDDLVAVRLTLTGTHLGEWGGRSATGNRIAVDHMFLLRMEAGVVVEVWEVPDTLALHQQLEPDPARS